MGITNFGYHIGNLYDILTEEQTLDLQRNIQHVKDCTLDKSDMNYRFDYAGGPAYSDNSVKENAIKAREEFVKQNNYHTFQRWWEYNVTDTNVATYFDNIAIKIGNILYPEYDITSADLNSAGNYTLYEIGDFIKDHEDGFDANRICVVLIYLSDNWHDGDGGELSIKTEFHNALLAPKLGNYAVLDFIKNNVSHQVLPVNNDFKRFTYIHFLNIKETDTTKYKQFKQDKLEFKH